MFYSNSKFLYDKFKAKNWIYSLTFWSMWQKFSTKKFTANIGGKIRHNVQKRIHNFSPDIKKDGRLVIFLNNFHKDWIEIGNFLPMSNYGMRLIFFFAQDFSYDLSKDLDFILDMIHMHANSCHNDITDFVTICIISMIPYDWFLIQ